MRQTDRDGNAGLAWMHKMRLRVLALLVASTVAVIGLVSLAALPVWPVVGVAVATVALVVNSMTAKMNQPVCWGCGKSIADQPSGEYGVICPHCGSLSQISRTAAASGEPAKRQRS
jgi:predicted RNA-binding Zn-ribbon protein involved in translation (DUF1610 family)